jgi:hypothetical protein
LTECVPSSAWGALVGVLLERIGASLLVLVRLTSSPRRIFSIKIIFFAFLFVTKDFISFGNLLEFSLCLFFVVQVFIGMVLQTEGQPATILDLRTYLNSELSISFFDFLVTCFLTDTKPLIEIGWKISFQMARLGLSTFLVV